MIALRRLDHLVLTVADLDATVAFYTSALGMTVETFGEDRTALHFGDSKINLHRAGHSFLPAAQAPTPGSADLCFVASGTLDDVVAHLGRLGVPIEEGPVSRTGALGPMESVYVRDPDRNLIEVCVYPS